MFIVLGVVFSILAAIFITPELWWIGLIAGIILGLAPKCTGFSTRAGKDTWIHYRW